MMSNQEDSIAPSRETLFAMAEAMAAASDGSLRIARNEADATTDVETEAATFLKLDGRRLGRDLEVYSFMARIMEGWGPVLPDLASEIVLQLKDRVPQAYEVGAATLVSMGRSVYPADSLEDWADIFADSAGPKP